MKENQLVRMEELLTRILFVSPLNRVEDRVDLEGGGTTSWRSSWVGGPVSHPEIFEFQDVIKI